MTLTKPKETNHSNAIPRNEAIAVPETSPPFSRNSMGVKLFALVIAAQVGTLFAFGVPYAQTLAFGKNVLLKCHTYDPRDPFKGDYVSVTYDLGAKVKFKDFKPGDTAFLTLKKGASCWEPIAANKEKPKNLKNDEAVMKVTYEAGQGAEASITTGIEKFYVPEGAGASVNSEGLTAEVALSNDGEPVLRRMLSDGKEIGKETSK